MFSSGCASFFSKISCSSLTLSGAPAWGQKSTTSVIQERLATGQLLISVDITIAVLQVHTYIKSAKQADLQEESRNNLEISL